METKITKDNFEAEVAASEIPVLVDYYADWCGPCKMMAPVVAKAAEKYEGRMKVGKCNIDEDIELAQRFRIMSIPALILYKNGEPVKTMIGAQPENELFAELDKLV